MKKILKKFGFTLIEIIIVVIILGVLGGIAMPRYTGMIERHRAQEGIQTLVVFLNAQRKYQLENGGNFAGQAQIAQLDIAAVPTRYFNAPTIDTSTKVVAKITRSDGSYTLTIDDQGQIYCLPMDSDQCITLACPGNAGLANRGAPCR